MRKSRFTDEQMVAILREADRSSVAEAAMKHKVSEQTLYVWRKHFAGLAPAAEVVHGDHDAVGPLAQVEVEQGVPRIEIDPAVVTHRRDECRDTALEHDATSVGRPLMLLKRKPAKQGKITVSVPNARR